MARKRTEPQSSKTASAAELDLEPGKAQAPDQMKLNAISAERLASLAASRRTRFRARRSRRSPSS